MKWQQARFALGHPVMSKHFVKKDYYRLEFGLFAWIYGRWHAITVPSAVKPFALGVPMIQSCTSTVWHSCSPTTLPCLCRNKTFECSSTIQKAPPLNFACDASQLLRKSSPQTSPYDFSHLHFFLLAIQSPR